jgi:hypothetical protein
MSKINVRSPYFITDNSTGTGSSSLTRASLQIRIYSGNSSTSLYEAQYTLDSNAIDGFVTFEISELVRDYIENNFDGDYTSSSRWVNYAVTRYYSSYTQDTAATQTLAVFDGYGYFSEGSNPQNNQTVLQSNKTIYKYSDEPLRLPVHITTSTEFTFLQDGTSVYNTTLSTSTSSTNIIRYVSSETTGIHSWQDRVEAGSGTIESLDCVKYHLGDVDLYGVDTIYVNDGNTVEVYKVENIEECKYNPYKVTFVNKFGALQDLWFFKRSNLSLQTKQESYKANIVNNGTYSINSRQNKVFNKTGIESLKLNTGFYPESYNEIFRQLTLSEEVWINYDGNTLPITVKSSSLNYKTSVNDKLINYTIDVEFANNKINNIR